MSNTLLIMSSLFFNSISRFMFSKYCLIKVFIILLISSLMIKSYGIIGLILIVLMQINLFVKIQPFEKLYFPLIWCGYILFIDALTYQKKEKSIVMNHFPALVGMFFISIPFWWMFELINLITANWHYIGGEFFGAFAPVFKTISFSIHYFVLV